MMLLTGLKMKSRHTLIQEYMSSSVSALDEVAVDFFNEIYDDFETTCKWKFESDEWSTWTTGCKSYFAFTEGNIKDNNFEYCPFCGHKIKEI